MSTSCFDAPWIAVTALPTMVAKFWVWIAMGPHWDTLKLRTVAFLVSASV